MRAAIVGGLLIVVAACVWWLLGGRGPPERTRPFPAPAATPTARGAPQPTDRLEPTDRPEPKGTLEVRVVRPGGEGVKAVPVVLAVGDREVARALTGADGWTRFPGRTERRLAVRLEPSGVRLPIGTFRPADGDLTLRHVLFAPRSLVIRVFCEGERRLPDRYCVAQPQLFDVRTGDDEIRGRFFPPGADRVEVWLQAPGFADGGGRVEASLATDPATVTIRLHKVVPLRLRAAGPTGIVENLTLERKRDGSWSEADASITILDDGFAYDLVPGRYRVVLQGTQAVLSEFDLDAPRDLDLDLTRAEWLVVHVETLPRYDGSVRVFVSSGGDEHPLPQDRRVRAWTFAAWVPGDRTFSIRAVHPLLLPTSILETDQGGTFTVRMRPGPLLRFQAAGGWGAPTVFLFRPDDLEHPVFFEQAARPPDPPETYGVTGWEPGTYAVLVKFRRHVPVLRHVTIPADGLDLGLLPQERGSWVRVTAFGGRPWIRVESLALPRIRRRERGHSPVTARGLPAGRYRLRYGAGDKEFEQEIVLDGETDLERVIDLR